MRARLASTCAVMASRCVRGSVELGVRGAQVGRERPVLGGVGVELHAETRGLVDRRVEKRANLGQVLFGRRDCRRLAAALGFGFHARRVDVGVGLDRGIEIAVDGVGALGLPAEVGAEPFGLGPGVGELGPEPVGLPKCVGQLAAERIDLRVCVGELASKRLDLAMGVG